MGLIFSCSTLKKIEKDYPSDNIVEEIVEEVIKDKTGIDIDLSPLVLKNLNPNEDTFAQLVFSQEGYKSRSQREALERE